jgi:hypothetical protein
VPTDDLSTVKHSHIGEEILNKIGEPIIGKLFKRGVAIDSRIKVLVTGGAGFVDQILLQNW